MTVKSLKFTWVPFFVNPKVPFKDSSAEEIGLNGHEPALRFFMLGTMPLVVPPKGA